MPKSNLSRKDRLISFILRMKFSVVVTLTGLVLGVGGALYRVAPTSYIAWFLVVSTLIIVSLYVAHLLVSRNELRERAEYNRQLLQRYSAEINERMTSFWQVESWNKKIVIHDNGDVTETSIVEATAAGRELSFFRLWTSTGQLQPLTYAARSGVHVQARGPMLANGRGGVERDVTWSWVSNGKLEVVAHFSSPVPVDERFVLIFEIFWPCKCERFVKRLQRDEFAFFVSNHLPKFEYTIELPKGKDALFDAIGFDPDRNPRASLARQHGETDGIVRIMLSYIDVVEKSRIGMSLQLK
jgi:hypothetical protein